jgi:hypothetical protein
VSDYRKSQRTERFAGAVISRGVFLGKRPTNQLAKRTNPKMFNAPSIGRDRFPETLWNAIVNAIIKNMVNYFQNIRTIPRSSRKQKLGKRSRFRRYVVGPPFCQIQGDVLPFGVRGPELTIRADKSPRTRFRSVLK